MAMAPNIPSNASQVSGPAQANGTRHRDVAAAATGSGQKSTSTISLSVPTHGHGGAGSQKSVDEHFQVDTTTGSFSTKFAIQTSPGRGGFGPALALTYDSGAGNGPFGIGWHLTMPSISRKTSSKIPQYAGHDDCEDVFVLSGSDDLVPFVDESTVEASPGGFQGQHQNSYIVQTFRPRTDDLSRRIERWTREADNQDVHWRVITRDNECTIYGWSDASRIYSPGNRTRAKRVFSWLPSRSYDVKGNAIEYRYQAEDATGLSEGGGSGARRPCATTQKYLKSIMYGNLLPSRDMKSWDIVLPDDTPIKDWAFEVVLDYHNGEPCSSPTPPWTLRQDPFSRFNSGFEIRTLRLCRRICMVHHFPNELQGRDHVLVSATEIHYQETAKGSFITSLNGCGYSSGPEGTVTHRQPPCQYRYSMISSPGTVQPQIMPGVMQTNDGGIDISPSGQWLDLHGEGAPGYLTTGDSGRWTYQRNLNPACLTGVTFGPPIELQSVPSGAHDAAMTKRFVDLDKSGLPDVTYFDQEGHAEGFVGQTLNWEESNDAQQPWGSFIPFSETPTVPLIANGAADQVSATTIQMLDLTGDGLQDLLVIDKNTEELIWYESLGKTGYAHARRRAASVESSSASSDLSSCLDSSVSASSSTSVNDDSVILKNAIDNVKASWPAATNQPGKALFTADMIGDGLADLVLVSNGAISYWPNLGYGRFGRQTVMQNSPLFDDTDQFSMSRLVLADVDGTGTTDILYLPARGGVDIYYNCFGDSWADVTRVNCLPAIDNISSVSAIDILGNGTSCLVWTGLDPTNACQSRLWYLPLMGRVKPHLLTSISNGEGLEMTTSYRPSTFFQQRDLLASSPWKTRMHTPLHCVHTVNVRDTITSAETLLDYAYHNGFYDPAEAVFGGFGMVEVTTSESIPLCGRLVELKKSLVKTWFHTGSLVTGRDLFWPDYPPNLDVDMQYGNVAVGNHNPRMLYRALRGNPYRREIYDILKKPQQSSPEGKSPDSSAEICPSVVEESTFSLRLLQSTSTEQPDVFAVFPSESLETVFDSRGQTEPRKSQSLTIEVDSWGNITKSMAINYGKTKSHLPQPEDRAKQVETVVMATAKSFTRGFSDSPGIYMEPREYESVSWRVFGMKQDSTKDGFSCLYSPSKLAHVFNLSQVPEVDAEESKKLHAPDSMAVSPHKVVVARSQQQFRAESLDKFLDLGQVDLFSVTDRTYQLCLTPSLVTTTYPKTPKVEQDDMMSKAGYVDLHGDGNWWTPSAHQYYHGGDGVADPELLTARASFYTPTVTTDPFGNSSTFKLDPYWLLITGSIDALGNTTHTKWDYTHLKEILTTDVNDNQKSSLLTSFGEVTAVASMGKPGLAAVGDSLDGLAETAELSQDALNRFHDSPTQASALALLGRAGSRLITSRHACYAGDEFKKLVPTWQATLSRVRHVNPEADHGEDQDDLEEKVDILFTFFDGTGRPVQTSVKLDDDIWRVELCVCDNGGSQVISYQPSLKMSHRFIPPSPLSSQHLAGTTFFDVQGRPVGHLNPDHTWTKAVFTPWSSAKYDAADVALIENPSEDAHVGHFFRALGDVTLYQPTWFQLTAANLKAAGDPSSMTAMAEQVHRTANSPRTTHHDALGRVILTVDEGCSDDGGELVGMRTTYGIFGSGACAIRDSLDRLTEVSKVDMLGQTIDRAGADYNRHTTLVDVEGREIQTWSSGGVSTLRTYDKLRRLTGRRVSAPSENNLKTSLVEKIVYGEELGISTAKERNLAGREYEHFDGAGCARAERVDFKGNVTKASRQFAVDYAKTLDWYDPSSVKLEPQVFVSYTRFDARNRVIETTDASGCSKKKVFDGAGQLRETYFKSKYDAGSPPGTSQWLRLSQTHFNEHGQPVVIKQDSCELDESTGKTTTTTTKTILEYGKTTQAILTKRVEVSSDSPARRNDPKVILDEEYIRDCLDRVIQQKDSSQRDMWSSNNRIQPLKTFAYDKLGRLVLASGRANAQAQPAGVKNGSRRRSGDNVSSASGPVLYEFVETYQYNAAGNLLRVQHQPKDIVPGVSGWTREYLYEEKSYLNAVTSPELAEAFPAMLTTAQDVLSKSPVSYNNRLSSTRIGRTTERICYDSSSPGGSRGCPSSVARWSWMSWDHDGMLRSSSGRPTKSSDKKDGKAPERTWYVYDWSGNRVRKVMQGKNNGPKVKETLYLDGVDIFRRFSPSPPSESGPSSMAASLTVKSERITIYENDSHAIVELYTDKDGIPRQILRYQVHNGLETDDKGNIISYEEYSPFGRTVFSHFSRKDITAPRRYRFAGYQRDQETGLYYCSSRYYAPWLGRWVSSDPIFSIDGLDTYAYCGNDPINFDDHSGTMGNFGAQATLAARQHNRQQGQQGALRARGVNIRNPTRNNPANGGQVNNGVQLNNVGQLNNGNQARTNAYVPRTAAALNTDAVNQFYNRDIAVRKVYYKKGLDRAGRAEWRDNMTRSQRNEKVENHKARVMQGAPLSEMADYRKYLEDNLNNPDHGREAFNIRRGGVSVPVIERALNDAEKQNLEIMTEDRIAIANADGNGNGNGHGNGNAGGNGNASGNGNSINGNPRGQVDSAPAGRSCWSSFLALLCCKS
jgi:RHS repeat-associated protein